MVSGQGGRLRPETMAEIIGNTYTMCRTLSFGRVRFHFNCIQGQSSRFLRYGSDQETANAPNDAPPCQLYRSPLEISYDRSRIDNVSTLQIPEYLGSLQRSTIEQECQI